MDVPTGVFTDKPWPWAQTHATGMREITVGVPLWYDKVTTAVGHYPADWEEIAEG